MAKIRKSIAARQAVRFPFRDWLKAQPCQDCGGRFPPECMDFDHVRGDKSICLGFMFYGFSLDKIQEELEKCDLVCANCHRTRTRKRREDVPD
jgi:hypothetical protein